MDVDEVFQLTSSSQRSGQLIRQGTHVHMSIFIMEICIFLKVVLRIDLCYARMIP